MCFKMTNMVEFVETPDAVEFVDVFESVAPVSIEAAHQQSLIAANILLQNKIVERVLTEAEKYPRVVFLESSDGIKPLPERSVVFCSTTERHYLDPNLASPEQIMYSRHLKLKNKIIVLQLKDFSYVAEYSISFGEDLPEGVLQRLEIRIKFGLESESGTVYRRTSQDSW